MYFSLVNINLASNKDSQLYHLPLFYNNHSCMNASSDNKKPAKLQFNCPICCKPYDERERCPMIICPPLHTCCLCCINILFKNKESQLAVSCPICDRKVERKYFERFRLLKDIKDAAKSIQTQGDYLDLRKSNGQEIDLESQLMKQRKKNHWLIHQLQYQEQLLRKRFQNEQRQLQMKEQGKPQVLKNSLPQIIFSNEEIQCSAPNFFSFLLMPNLVNLQNVTKITVRNHVIDHKFWAELDEILCKMREKDILILDNCTFVNGFSDLFGVPQPSISIINSGLTDQNFCSIFHYLNQYRHFDLDLSNNQLGEDEQAIAEMLRLYLPDIFVMSTLNLSGNPMRPDFVKELQEEYSERTKIIF